MKHIKSLNEFLFEQENKESDLFKVYLGVRRSSGHRWWTYKGFAGNNFFLQVTENNIDKINLNPDYPILSYSTHIINQLLDEDRIKQENIYNEPEFIELSGSKEKFHKFIGEDENLPPTVFTQKAAYNLNFPIIAKPSVGHSGIGIEIIESADKLKDLDGSKFNVYSEFIDKSEEHRFINFKGKPIFWMERRPVNDKAKTGTGKADEKMMFQYIKRNVNDIPKEYTDVLTKYCDKFKDLPYITFDIMRSKDDKIYIIESNTQCGVPFDSTIEIYKAVFEDFYGRPVNDQTLEILDEYSKKLIDMTIEKESDRFVDESNTKKVNEIVITPMMFGGSGGRYKIPVLTKKEKNEIDKLDKAGYTVDEIIEELFDGNYNYLKAVTKYLEY